MSALPLEDAFIHVPHSSSFADVKGYIENGKAMAERNLKDVPTGSAVRRSIVSELAKAPYRHFGSLLSVKLAKKVMHVHLSPSFMSHVSQMNVNFAEFIIKSEFLRLFRDLKWLSSLVSNPKTVLLNGEVFAGLDYHPGKWGYQHGCLQLL